VIKSQDEHWLMLAVSTAGGSDSLRVTVWRRLRGLGVLYLQQSVCLLPDRPEVARAVHRLVVQVRAAGGSARMLHVHLSDAGERAQVVTEMRAAVEVEYREVLQRLPSFFSELELESARGNFTFTEIEESEADLDRFEAWLTKIAKRDYFDAPLAAQVRTELDRARGALRDFEAEAWAAENYATPTADAKPGLRSIRGEKS
jgi:ChrB-like protein